MAPDQVTGRRLVADGLKLPSQNLSNTFGLRVVTQGSFSSLVVTNVPLKQGHRTDTVHRAERNKCDVWIVFDVATSHFFITLVIAG